MQLRETCGAGVVSSRHTIIGNFAYRRQPDTLSSTSRGDGRPAENGLYFRGWSSGLDLNTTDDGLANVVLPHISVSFHYIILMITIDVYNTPLLSSAFRPAYR